MRVLPIALTIAAQAPITPASADRWIVDLTLRGAGSIEASSGDAMPVARRGVVPALGVRVERRLGPIHAGAQLVAGFPAFYGEHEAALTADVERVLARRRCTFRPAAGGGMEPHCRGARIALSAGADLGIGMLFFDAPPETASSSDALLYAGPRGRLRTRLSILYPTPNGKLIGWAIGAGVAATRAHYMSTAEGTGLRIEPSLEIGLEMRL